jgi:hypothetical protein
MGSSVRRSAARFFLLYEVIFPIGLMFAGMAGYFLVPIYGWEAIFVVACSAANRLCSNSLSSSACICDMSWSEVIERAVFSCSVDHPGCD